MADVGAIPMWAHPRHTARRDRAGTSAREIESLYRELSPRVLGYLRANGASDPEDLLGEVFLQVARDFDRFSGSATDRRRWVFGIARHRLIDAWRRQAARPALADVDVPEAAAMAHHEFGIDPELVAALRELTEDQREVVVLRFVGDLTLRDVAEVVGRDVGAVKALQHRGLASLQRALDAGTDGPTRAT
jgi:RNA polymerase sigma-70 factor (ECF subfamily)